MGDYNYMCDKCPRTFKLEEFYEKHKKVHELKKQHKCDICGFVYGAAKGLEGHMKTHSEDEVQRNGHHPSSSPVVPPYNMDFHFLNRRGVLAQAPCPKVTAKPRREKSSSTEMSVMDDVDKKPNTGTGKYKIYDFVPNVDNDVPNENGFFSCVVCKREFSGINSLKKHIPIHTRTVQHSCDMCGFVFGKRDYLIDHMRKHTGDVGPIVCDVCGLSFSKSLKLKEHHRIHRNLLPDGTVHEVVPFRCHICREVFQLPTALGNHLTSVHNDIAPNSPESRPITLCPLCNTHFPKFYDLKVHMFQSHGKEYMDNNVSPEQFAAMINSLKQGSVDSSLLSKRRPSQIEFIPTKEPSTIHKMNMQLNGATDASIHSMIGMLEPKLGQKTHAYEEDIPMITIKPVNKPCPASKRRKPGPASRTNAPMENRVSASNIPTYIDPSLYEENKNGFQCKECGKVLQHKQSLVSHMRVIHGNFYGANKWKGHSSVVDMIIEESAKLSPKKKNGKGGMDANATLCSVCEQVFPNQSSLRNHVVNVHIQGQNFTCDLCGKAFLCQENLDAHIKSKHPNLIKRLQSLRDALGLSTDDQPSLAKRARLSEQNFLLSGISTAKPSSLPSTSVLSLSAVNSSSLSSSPIVVDFPTSKDYPLNNNNEGEGPQPPLADLFLAQSASGTTSSSRKKNSICKVCGVVLSPKTNVNVHMRTHSGARPYQCVLCHNKFRQKAHLMKHFRCSHNQKKPPYICLFCPDECASSNDLYRHITDKHVKETDELARVNGLTRDDEIKIDNEVQSEQTMELQQLQPEPQVEESDDQVQQEYQQEDVRYEPITEAFVFEDQVIHPCYVVLPFVTDNEVETLCNKPTKDEYLEAENDEDEGQLTIDEGGGAEDDDGSASNEPNTPVSLLNKVGKQVGLSGEELLHKPDNGNYNAEDIKLEIPHPGFYPNLGDFSLPFSLSSIWKKKVDILPPETLHQLEMIQKMEEIKQMNAPVSEKVHKPKPACKQNKGKSPSSRSSNVNNNNNNNNNNVSNGKKEGSASTTQVSDYESQIQNDIWPLNCIKCSTLLGSLDNFNLHMNDHWSEDKCCPVCGLLINSKRFNFKQHLKIHTGEKPFTCQICNRSFRQKAHMVKHVTTHRTIPNSNEMQSALAVK